MVCICIGLTLSVPFGHFALVSILSSIAQTDTLSPQCSASRPFFFMPRKGLNLEFCQGSGLGRPALLRFPTAEVSLTCATCTRDLRNFSSFSEKTRCSTPPSEGSGTQKHEKKSQSSDMHVRRRDSIPGLLHERRTP